MNTVKSVQRPNLTPLVQEDEAISGADEGPEDLGDEEEEDEEEEESVKGKTNTKRTKEMIAAATGDDYANMPYPIIIDSGAAESALPTHWCPQAELQGGATKGKP